MPMAIMLLIAIVLPSSRKNPHSPRNLDIHFHEVVTQYE